MAVDAELGTLADGLPSDRQRRQDQDGAVCMPDDVLGPYQLHRRLAESAVSEDRSTTLADCPGDERALKIEKEVRHPERFKSAGSSDLRFPFKERGVIVHRQHRNKAIHAG